MAASDVKISVRKDNPSIGDVSWKGQETGFRVVKENNNIYTLHHSSNNRSMNPQRFTNPQKLVEFIDQAETHMENSRQAKKGK